MRAAQAKIKLMFPQRRAQERAAKNLKREILLKAKIMTFSLFIPPDYTGYIFVSLITSNISSASFLSDRESVTNFN
jgi:hypothetical protein